MDRKRQKTNEGKDILSNLPEQIISQILSCLPLRDAVRTSVLSKKWISRWTCLTKLELNDQTFYHGRKKTGKQHFIDFMNRSLLLASSSVQSLILVIRNKHDPLVFNTWIANILMSRNLKKLDLRYPHHDLNLSPLSSHYLFQKNNYYRKELILKMGGCAIRIPESTSYSFIHFSRLELLDLSGITFTHHSKDVNLSCPVLKELKTRNCYWLRVKCVTFTVPLLESFSIEHSSIAVSKSGEESLDNYAAMIKICAKQLTEFTCGGDMLEDVVFGDPSSTKGATANITLQRPEKVNLQQTQIRISKLFKQLIQIKCLKLVGTEVLAKCEVSLKSLPWLKMLTHLELDLVNAQVLLGLLHMSPVIRTLEFKGISNKFEKEILNSAGVPKCLLSTLEVVKFGRIHGNEHEL
ncbi:hypothetical protein PIB30_000136 [Stylosanthes scabra]|uniref:F-box domain-containing protein n=1 Tax=Stylosanthes scabra TaxID=79078 RepID=A0ABU6R2K4_9FABA|nr:hypothetical protein [Stylosanthes scabra]